MGPSRKSRLTLNIRKLAAAAGTVALVVAAAQVARADSWSTAAPMPTPRFALGAATGVDGRIYAIGGVDSIPTNVVEAYDPAADTWAPAAVMLTTRGALAVTAGTGSDTRVYAIGGISVDGNILNTLEVYGVLTNFWSSGPPMPTARASLAAVTAQCPPPAGGRRCVYAIGGVDQNGNALDNLEAFDPLLGTWTMAAPMPTPREKLAAVRGGDGRIYAIGGASGMMLLNTVEAYDPATSTWATNLAAMPTARQYLGAAIGSDGRIYAIGGATDQFLDAVEAYDTTANTWSTNLPAMSTPRSALGVAGTDDGRIFAVGGAGGDPILPTALNMVEVLGPLSDRWDTRTPMPTPRGSLAAATGTDGRIYVAGGIDNSGTVLSAFEAYDPSMDSWTALAPLPTPRYEPAAALGPDGRIYVLGGRTGNLVLNTVEAYDPNLPGWRSVSPLPTARAGLAAATAACPPPNGARMCVYAIGGSSSGQLDGRDVVEAYDPQTDTWTTAAPIFPASYQLAAAAGADGRIYAFGGIAPDASVGFLREMYDPAINSWLTVSLMPTPRQTHGMATGPNRRVYAIGGFDALRGITSDIAEAYTPATDVWIRLAPMPTARLSLAVAAGTNRRVYAIGGINLTLGGVLATVESLGP